MSFLAFILGFSLALVYERSTAKYEGLGIMPWAGLALVTGAIMAIQTLGFVN